MELLLILTYSAICVAIITSPSSGASCCECGAGRIMSSSKATVEVGGAKAAVAINSP